MLSQHVGTEERDSEYDVSSSWRAGITAGVSLYWPVTDRFGLQQELAYSRRGSEQEIDVEILEVPTTLDVTYEMDYLDIPLLARLTLLRRGGSDLYSVAGTSMSVRVRGRYRLRGLLDDGVETISLTADADLSEVDMFDFAMVYGTGLDVPFQGLRLLFEYRFTMSWSTLYMPTYAYVPFEGEEMMVENDPVPLKNQGHSLMIGVRF